MSSRALAALALAGFLIALALSAWAAGDDGGGTAAAPAPRLEPTGDLGAGPRLKPQTELGGEPTTAVLPKAEPAQAERTGLAHYRGAGAWVDQYDAEVLDNSLPALEEMRARGVKTLYLETGSWRLPRRMDFRDRRAMRVMIDQAHALGMKVVAWYLPGLDDVPLDLRRTRAALRLRSLEGAPFDGFAADIESQRVRSIGARNAALMRYSRALRRAAGDDYALGAIIPDERSSTISPGLWPGLPYGPLAEIYDVFLPMAYSTYRGHGSAYVYRYTRSNVEFVRRATGRPVHLIGGLDPGLRPAEPAAIVRAARDGGAIGASFYDFAGATGATWRALKLVP
jgi:hypothetical protein